MHKNKVIQLLRSLSAEEMRQLDKFVRSPVHNRHEAVINLFRYARKHLDNGERALKKEAVFEFLFPGEAFDMQKVHYVSSYLLKTVEEFLAWQEWRGEEANFQFHLMQAYRKRHQLTPFETTFKKAQKVLYENAFRDVTYLQRQYQLELERFSFDRSQQSSSKAGFNLQELSEAQDAAYIAEKLKNACILLSNQAVIKTTYDTGLLSQVLDFLKNSPLLEIPAIAIYFHASQTLAGAHDDESFLQLKKLLNKHQKSFNVSELHDIYIFAINYCIRRFNSGEQQFMQEVFDLYRLGMEPGAFIQNGVISPRTYSNVVMSGLRANEYGWIENFIHQYKNFLPEKQREGFFNYNLARLHYERKNYREAMPLLLQMEYEDVLLTCTGKILLAKMQYELDEFDALASLLQSFKTYIGRKKMLGYHRDTFLNFIHFTQKLMQNTPGAAGQLQQEIAGTKVLAEKEWLLAQVGVD